MTALQTKLLGTLIILVLLSAIFAYAGTPQEVKPPPSNIISNLPTVKELLMAAPTMKTQLVLWLIHSLLWYFICSVIAYPILVALINKMECKQQFIHLIRETWKKMLGIDIGEGDTAVSFAAITNTCLIQHTTGGLLCMPSGFGMASLLPPGIAYAMARQGNLCELGYETGDYLLRLYEIMFGGVLGRSKNPPGMMLCILLHHTASFCMVIPLNLYYPDYAAVHELSCLLQLAATIAISLQNYGYTVNVKTSEGLSKMKVSVSISFVIIMWSRVIRYFWLLWNVGWTIWQDGNWLVFKLFCGPAVCLTLFNVIMFGDATQKLLKFLPMSIKKHSEEKIVDIATDAASAGLLARRPSSCFGLNKSEKEWAKIRGMIRMGVFRAAALRRTKED